MDNISPTIFRIRVESVLHGHSFVGTYSLFENNGSQIYMGLMYMVC